MPTFGITSPYATKPITGTGFRVQSPFDTAPTSTNERANIAGSNYQVGTGDYNAAVTQDMLRNARNTGEAAGTQAGTAVNTLRQLVPDLFDTGAVSNRIAMSGAGGGAQRVAPPVMNPFGGGGGSPTPMPQIVMPDTSAADAAAFARAKDKIGQITRGSITSLRNLLGARGLSGGGMEAAATSGVVSEGAGDLSEAVRDQVLAEAARNADFAKTGYAGNITQRGQDLSAKQSSDALAARLAEAAYQGEITQRGQDLASQRDELSFMSEQERQKQLILDKILNSLTPLY